MIKLLALGFKGYVADRLNIFDGLVVIASLVELVIFAVLGFDYINPVMNIFRIIRLLRLFKLVR